MKLININFNKNDKIIFVSIFFISLLLFIFYVNLNAYENFWDEIDYVRSSHHIINNEPIEEKILSVRTYLYPTIIASINIFTNDDVILKTIFSVVQYAVYLVTVILIANYFSLFPKLRSKSSFPMAVTRY